MNRTEDNNIWANIITWVVVIGVIWALVSIGSCNTESQSAEGMGGDPNPEAQTADPCSYFERNCDEGTSATDTVPDRNGDLPDQ